MTWDINLWPADPRVRRGFELLGRIVRTRRLRLALSQRQLESLTGVDQSVISRLENGKLYGLRWARFARIVDALDGLEHAAPPREHRPWPGHAGAPPGQSSTTDAARREPARADRL